MKAKRLLHLIHSPEHAGWIVDSAHPTQGRRYINALETLLSLAKTCDLEIVEVRPSIATECELERVHSHAYVDSVLVVKSLIRVKMRRKKARIWWFNCGERFGTVRWISGNKCFWGISPMP